jgi:hypothetical protein
VLVGKEADDDVVRVGFRKLGCLAPHDPHDVGPVGRAHRLRCMGDSGDRTPVGARNDAESILEERFARGEIDADELASRRKALHASGGKRAA